MIKSTVRITCFILILGVVLGYVNKVFKVKYPEGIYDVTKFYELDNNTVDVLILGSSHAFININTGTLWDEYGIASYILGGSSQPMWNTYYYLKEALKTQTPELIVLEGYKVTFDSEYGDDVRIVENNFGLRWSKDKIDSIKVSAPEDRWTEFFLEYVRYHTRYTELSDADFLKNQHNRLYDDWKGFLCYMDTRPQESTDVHGITGRIPLQEKTEKYYRATIELAQMNNIPIIVVVSPYANITAVHQEQFNTAGDIAAEYGIPFVNCNLLCDKIGIDYSTDAYNYSHLNYRGSQKFASFLGSHLKENYDISDRRGDPAYESWQRHAAYITQMIENQILKETNDIGQLAEKLQDPDYWLFISVDGNCTTSDENLQNFYSALGIPAGRSSGVGYHSASGWEWYSKRKEVEQYIRVEHDFCIKRTADKNGKYKNAIIIDNTQYQKVKNGVNIVVYDTVTEKVTDTIGINADDGYKIKR